MQASAAALTGLVVVERAGRIATAAAASLLAALGARVIRVELSDEAARVARASAAERGMRVGGKERVYLAQGGPQLAETWRRIYAAGEVLLYDPPLEGDADRAIVESLLAQRGGKVICAISPAGLDGADLPCAAGDVLVQAVGGLMAVTGVEGGRPEYSRVPIAELTSAVIAVTSILAALRVLRRDGVGQTIDLSLIEIMADQLRTHLPQVVVGETRGFRLGCRHPIAAPWNVFRARDGWMLICSASDVQWRALLGVIGRTELKDDPRFASAALRRKHVAEVDEIVQSWVGRHDIAAAVAAIETIDLPAGPAQSIAQVVGDDVLAAAGTVYALPRGEGSTTLPSPPGAFAKSGAGDEGRDAAPDPTTQFVAGNALRPYADLPSPSFALPRGEGSMTLPSPPGRRAGDEGRDAAPDPTTQFVAGSALRLSRTPPIQVLAGSEITGSRTYEPPRAQPRVSPTQQPRPPLAGVRVVEISRYAAGPLAGMVLASLGADVLKVEAPGGEDCRSWTPRFGQVSGYFANYNAGKRSIVLDLRGAAARAQLAALVANADVVLQNLRPGTLERMGFGPDAVTQAHTRVVYASISGFGLRGPPLAALDTVMQGRLGLTAVIGDGHAPLRVGYSIADQLAGHYAAAGILAALTERERSGRGQIVDIAMSDAIAWLTQIAWNGGRWEPEVSQWMASDGWAVASATVEAVKRALDGVDAACLTRSEFVHTLAQCGILSAPVLEVDEVLAQPVILKRRSLYSIETGDGATTSVFAVPLGLTLTPVLRAQRMSRLGADAQAAGCAAASV